METGRIFEQGGEVVEQDARFRVVGDLADQRFQVGHSSPSFCDATTRQYSIENTFAKSWSNGASSSATLQPEAPGGPRSSCVRNSASLEALLTAKTSTRPSGKFLA